MSMRDGWLTTAEFAELAGVTQQTVRRRAVAGLLETRRSGRMIEVREVTPPRKKARDHARELARLLDDDPLLGRAAAALAAELEADQ